MKRLKIVLLCACSAMLLLSACIKQLSKDPEDHSIKLTIDTVRVTQGITQYLAAKNYDAAEINWSSSDTTVATIDSRGVITGLKAGQAVLTAESKVYKASAKCVVIVLGQSFAETKVSDVAVGRDGSVFAIGTDIVSPSGGYGIYKLTGNKLSKLPYCAGVRIAVDSTGRPWVVNKSHYVFRYRDSLSYWDQLPGTANDIAIANSGDVYAVGTTPSSSTGGFNIMKWNGSGWNNLPDCAGIRIAAGAQATPWVVNYSHLIFKFTGNYLWEQTGTLLAGDIAVGPEGSVYVTESVAAGVNPQIYKYTSGNWVGTGLYGIAVAVRPNGSLLWIDQNNVLHAQ